MDAMVLLRANSSTKEPFFRKGLVRRSLLSSNDPRLIRTFELEDGSVAIDLLCNFQDLKARPAWRAVSAIRQILGRAFETHEDPRGFFVFAFSTAKPKRYEDAVEVHPQGLWLPKAPAYPSAEVADSAELMTAYANLEEEKHRQLRRSSRED